MGSGSSLGQLVAPLSGSSLGTRRAEIKPGVREIHLCKDEHGKTGLRLKAIDQVGLGAGQESRGHFPHTSPTSLGGGSAGPVHSKEGAEQAGEPRPTQSQAQALPLNLPPPGPQGWCWVPAIGTIHLPFLGSNYSEPPFPPALHQRDLASRQLSVDSGSQGRQCHCKKPGSLGSGGAASSQG